MTKMTKRRRAQPAQPAQPAQAAEEAHTAWLLKAAADARAMDPRIQRLSSATQHRMEARTLWRAAFPLQVPYASPAAHAVTDAQRAALAAAMASEAEMDALDDDQDTSHSNRKPK